MAYLVSKGDWPAKAALLCVTNDLIWLIPFAIYFADYLRFYRSTNGEVPCLQFLGLFKCPTTDEEYRCRRENDDPSHDSQLGWLPRRHYNRIGRII
jgi:hypothetical protein